jgi:endonuclease G
VPGFAACRWYFPGGQAPRVADLQARKPRDLCYEAFAILHSGREKTPIFVVERLTSAQLRNDRSGERTDKFFADARVPAAQRAQLSDYSDSGYDRGHMAPAGDMPTPTAMAQSFSLANMVPQAPQNNRGVWAKLESDTRKYVLRAQGPVFVFTGPVYSNRPRTIGSGEVAVPSYLFKLVYDQHAGRAWAHWVPNSDDARAGAPISYRELVRRTGIEFLPGILANE